MEASVVHAPSLSRTFDHPETAARSRGCISGALPIVSAQCTTATSECTCIPRKAGRRVRQDGGACAFKTEMDDSRNVASKFRRPFPLHTAAPIQSPAGEEKNDRGGGVLARSSVGEKVGRNLKATPNAAIMINSGRTRENLGRARIFEPAAALRKL